MLVCVSYVDGNLMKGLVGRNGSKEKLIHTLTFAIIQYSEKSYSSIVAIDYPHWEQMQHYNIVNNKHNDASQNGRFY